MNLPDWVPFAVAVALLAARHAWVLWRSEEARGTRVLRGEWVARIMRSPGSEILAIQTLRNSIMAASVMASTSAVGLMGVVSLGHLRTPFTGGDSLLRVVPADLGQVRYVFPVLLLAACVLLFSKTVRLYHRVGFLLGLSHGASEHAGQAQANAVDELVRASVLYRHGWRLFYAAIATGAWLISGWVSLVVTLAMLAVDVVARAE